MKRLYYAFIICYVIVTFSVGFISSNIIPGTHFYTNTSGSMSPIIDTGSLIMVNTKSSYAIGDIVSYNTLIEGKETVVTHRIVGYGGNVYITKGDANTAIDREVIVPRLIVGKVVLIVPVVGYAITIIKSPIGILFFILIPASGIILSEVISILKSL
ncbi:signal peptidase I [Candidatus Woesebacteria bacterium]|nr:signal peptidase I [Candidatus Woesebacteria bacterium]